MTLAARRLAVVALVLIALAPGEAVARSVTLRAADGAAIAAEWHEPSRPAPAVVLVHMLTRSRADWNPAIEPLRAAGVGVLAIDLRGHGGSTAVPGADYQSMLQDVHAALAFLRGREDVLPGRIGIAGASIGASLAVLAAAADPAVRSLALLSPSLDYRGLKNQEAMRKLGERPVLLVAGGNDPYAVRSARDLAAIGPGMRDLRILDDTRGHGTVLLVQDPELAGELASWFTRTLF